METNNLTNNHAFQIILKHLLRTTEQVLKKVTTCDGCSVGLKTGFVFYSVGNWETCDFSSIGLTRSQEILNNN